MAPRGRSGRGGGANTRNQTTTKPSTRGGISKRSGGRNAPIDKDGDLDMDATASNRGRATRNPPTGPRDPGRSHTSRRGDSTAKGPSRASERVARAVSRHLSGEGTDMVKKKQDVQLVWLDVKGLKESKAASNEDGGVRDLLSFLERKATAFTQKTPPVVIKKSRNLGNVVEIGASAEDAEELIKVNSFSFASSKLEITDHNNSLAQARESRANTEDLKTKLTNILSIRYAVDAKLLKLDGLIQDQALVSMGMLESKERAEKLILVMMKICDELFKTNKEKMDNVHSISLANNGIDSIAPVESVVETFPDLYNLDLSNNNIADTNTLLRWKGRFRKLHTLYIANNPLNIADPKVKAQLVQVFPKLKDINGEQLTPKQLEELRNFTKPRAIPQSGPDFRDANGLGETFLVDLFALFDTDRHGLLAKYYDDESQFSLAVDQNSIRDKDAPQPMPWAAYIQKSRNLTRITSENGRKSRLFTGREAILPMWNELPTTKHPDIKAETTKYIMDCHLLPGLCDPTGQAPFSDGMIISVHGQFEEVDKSSGKQGLRSFSRSIVLGPGKPGNNNIRVVSDIITLRAFNPLPNVFGVPPGPSPEELQLRQAKIAELCKQTMMTPAYSEMCLSDSEWDFDRALAVFNLKKPELPAEAFAST